MPRQENRYAKSEQSQQHSSDHSRRNVCHVLKSVSGNYSSLFPSFDLLFRWTVRFSFIPGIWPISGLVIVKKQIDISFFMLLSSYCILFRHNIVKVCCGTMTRLLDFMARLWCRSRYVFSNPGCTEFCSST